MTWKLFLEFWDTGTSHGRGAGNSFCAQGREEKCSETLGSALQECLPQILQVNNRAPALPTTGGRSLPDTVLVLDQLLRKDTDQPWAPPSLPIPFLIAFAAKAISIHQGVHAMIWQSSATACFPFLPTFHSTASVVHFTPNTSWIYLLPLVPPSWSKLPLSPTWTISADFWFVFINPFLLFTLYTQVVLCTAARLTFQYCSHVTTLLFKPLLITFQIEGKPFPMFYKVLHKWPLSTFPTLLGISLPLLTSVQPHPPPSYSLYVSGSSLWTGCYFFPQILCSWPLAIWVRHNASNHITLFLFIALASTCNVLIYYLCFFFLYQNVSSSNIEALPVMFNAIIFFSVT